MKEGDFPGDWSPASVALFGVGQVGTAIGLALRGRVPEARIIVCDPNPAALAAGEARGLIPDQVLRPEPPYELRGVDVVVLAAPVPEIVRLVEPVAAGVSPDGLLIDTGSAKAVVVEAMRRLPAEVHAIGGHPLAGTEVPGPEGADPERLRGAPFVLTPAREDPAALGLARAFVLAVGARPVVVSAEDHDRVVARTSHLPHLAAYALSMVAAGSGESDTVRALSGTGLAGATRLAASDPVMVAAFLSANRGEVHAAVAELQAALATLARAVDADVVRLAEALEAAASRAREEVGP